MDLMMWRQIGALAGCVAAVVLLSFVRRFSTNYKWQLRMLMSSSFFVFLSGAFAVVSVFLDGGYANCPCLRAGKFVFGACSSINWCFGVTYLYGTSRQTLHKHQRELMGSMAIFVVAGELCGLFFGFLVEDYKWLYTHSGVRIVTPIVFCLAYYCLWPCLEHYGRGTDDTQVIPEEDDREDRRSLSICNWDFLFRLIRSILLFALVDFTRNMYKMSFHDIFEKIGADSSNVRSYTLGSDGSALVMCLLSIIILSRYCKWWHSDESRQIKLFVCGICGLLALFAILVLDLSPVTTTHHIGYIVIFYTVQSALCMEFLLEILPDLFLPRNFAFGWSITLAIRHAVTLTLFFIRQLIIAKLPTWAIFSMCVLFQLVFILSVFTPHQIYSQIISWYRRRSQPVMVQGHNDVERLVAEGESDCSVPEIRRPANYDAIDAAGL
ncbi:hypothetical protein Ddc_11215 [Ditylenchus destructor]|nr:hypothetical protein Ddc_11215 [Ditylenchus destructor]